MTEESGFGTVGSPLTKQHAKIRHVDLMVEYTRPCTGTMRDLWIVADSSSKTMVVFFSSTGARNDDALPGQSIHDLRCDSASKNYTQ